MPNLKMAVIKKSLLQNSMARVHWQETLDIEQEKMKNNQKRAISVLLKTPPISDTSPKLHLPKNPGEK
jgi:hypothetical protein